MKARSHRGKKSQTQARKHERPGVETSVRKNVFASSQTPSAPAEAELKVQADSTPKSASRATAVTPGIGAAEALSFLKDTKGEVSWTAKEMAQTLRINAKEAAQALLLLQMQGYVKATGSEWLTTPAGEAVSGAKPPRFARESVEKALTALKERMAEFNRDGAQELKVTEAVAFGDFLSARAQVQAADVGVKLTRRKGDGRMQHAGLAATESAVEQAAQNAMLRKLRGRTALLHLRPHEAWMSHRLHRKII